MNNTTPNNSLTSSIEKMYHVILVPFMAMVYLVTAVSKLLIDIPLSDIFLLLFFPFLFIFFIKLTFYPKLNKSERILSLISLCVILTSEIFLIIKFPISKYSNDLLINIAKEKYLYSFFYNLIVFLGWSLINLNFVNDILNLRYEKKGKEFFYFLSRIEKNKIIAEIVTFIFNIQRHQNTKLVKLKHVTQKIINETKYSVGELANYNLSKMSSLPKTLHESFEYSLNILNNIFDSEKSFAWYVAINDIKAWTNEWKADYFIKFLSCSINKKNLDIRRVYVVDKLNFSSEFHKLFEVVFLSHLCGVNTRILVFEKIGNDSNIIYKALGNLHLLDYGILLDYDDNYFTTKKSVKRIICSDIDINDENNEKDLNKNKIYVLDDYYTFNSFQEHFLSLWEHKEYKKHIENKWTKKISGKPEIYDIEDLINHTLFRVQNLSINWNSISLSLKLFDRRELKTIEDELSKINKSFIDDNTAQANLFLKHVMDKNFIFREIKHTSNEY